MLVYVVFMRMYMEFWNAPSTQLGMIEFGGHTNPMIGSPHDWSRIFFDVQEIPSSELS